MEVRWKREGGGGTEIMGWWRERMRVVGGVDEEGETLGDEVREC